jgi:hypothetical protein
LHTCVTSSNAQTDDLSRIKTQVRIFL